MNLNNSSSAIKKLADVFLQIPFNRTLGLRLDELEQTHIKMSFDMKEDLVGNFLLGILHGGVISSVLDMAGGMAAMTSVIYKQSDKSFEEIADVIGKTSTIDMQVSFIRPGKGDSFSAKAYVLNTGNKISFTRMELFNQESSLIATGSAAYLIG